MKNIIKFLSLTLLLCLSLSSCKEKETNSNDPLSNISQDKIVCHNGDFS